jgi:hypothetical protein
MKKVFGWISLVLGIISIIRGFIAVGEGIPISGWTFFWGAGFIVLGIWLLNKDDKKQDFEEIDK